MKKISPSRVKDLLSGELKLDTRITTLGHVQRGGEACAYDRQLATLQGVEAVKAILDAKPGDPSYFISIEENKIARKPLLEAVATTQSVATAIEKKDFQKAMALRGAEFAEYYDAYMMTTATDQPGLRLPAEKVNISPLSSPSLTSYSANEHRHHPHWRSGRRWYVDPRLVMAMNSIWISLSLMFQESLD